MMQERYMDWTDIIIKISTKDTETAAAVAQLAVPRGIYIEDYSDIEEEIKQFGPVEIIDEALLKKDRSTACIHVYISPQENPQESVTFLQERLTAAGIAYETDMQRVSEEDWANNWKQYFKPLPVGQKLIIVPTWHQEPIQAHGRVQLTIDPGMAFGSGQHETTRLCLELLEQFVQPSSSLLDVGTGSGILAVAALLMGAENALGVDIDKLSVKIAEENAALNGVGGRFRAICGDLAKNVSGVYDIITANIVADIILQLLPDTARLLKKDGILILSGIIAEREADVFSGISQAALQVRAVVRDRGWCAIACGPV